MALFASKNRKPGSKIFSLKLLPYSGTVPYLRVVLIFFRSNQVSTGILLAIFTLLVHLPALLGFITPDAAPADGAGMFYNLLFGWLAAQPLLSAIASALLVFIQGLLVNWLVNNSRVNPERNWLAPLLYVLVMSCVPDFLFLSPAIVAVTVMPIMLRLIFQIYKSADPTMIVFDAGFLTALGALFYIPTLWLFPVILLGLTHLRSLKPREIAVFMTGLFIPGFLGWIVALWNNMGGGFIQLHFSTLWQFWDFQTDFQLSTLLRSSLLLLLALTVLLSFNVYYQKRLMQVQKYNNILYWIILVTCVTAILRKTPSVEHFALAGTSVGIFMALSFQSLKNKAIAEVLFFGLLAVIGFVMFIF